MKPVASYIATIESTWEKDKPIFMELFRNKIFQSKVWKIREAFNLSAYGIKTRRGVTDKMSKIELTRHKRKFQNEMSLLYSAKVLKSLGINVKSRRSAFKSSVKAVRVHYELPPRYQQWLEYYVMYDKIPLSGVHSNKTIVWIFRDVDENRMFIEISGDTKFAHIKDAWKKCRVEALKKRHQIKGGQLFREKNFFRALRYIEDGKADEDLNVGVNIIKHRHKKRHKKA